jgi:hypothetical protein
MRNQCLTMSLVLVLCGVVSAATLINIDIGGGPVQVGPAVLGNAGDKWNAIGATTANLLDSTGAVTGITFTFTPGGGFAYNKSGTVGNAAIKNLMQDYWFNGSWGTVSFSGMVPGSDYKLVCFSGEYGKTNTYSYTVDGVAKSITENGLAYPYPLIEGVHYVVFEGKVPFGGVLLVDPSGPNVNGFQLQVADRGMAHTPAPVNGDKQVDTTVVSSLSWLSPDDPNIASVKYDVYTRSFNPITKVEAENYTAMSGIGTETTSDVGGGQSVGWIENGDWTEYAIYVPASGTYVMSFRVARPGTGTSTINMTLNGSAIGSVTVPSTGGWGTWTTVNTTATFSGAGEKTLRLTFGGGFNFNWFTYQAEPTAIGALQLVDPNNTTRSYPVTLVPYKTYDWRVDTRVTWDSNEITGSFTTVVPGKQWQFTTKSNYYAPVLTFGSVITTQTLLPANLSATVTANTLPITSVTFTLLTDDVEYPAGANAVLTNTTTSNQNPTATLTTDKTGKYKVKLVVSDGENPAQKVAEVVVYADACAAKKASPSGWTADYFDTNGDCIINLKDFADMADEWLNQTSMTVQETYPGI